MHTDNTSGDQLPFDELPIDGADDLPTDVSANILDGPSDRENCSSGSLFLNVETNPSNGMPADEAKFEQLSCVDIDPMEIPQPDMDDLYGGEEGTVKPCRKGIRMSTEDSDSSNSVIDPFPDTTLDQGDVHYPIISHRPVSTHKGLSDIQRRLDALADTLRATKPISPAKARSYMEMSTPPPYDSEAGPANTHEQLYARTVPGNNNLETIQATEPFTESNILPSIESTSMETDDRVNSQGADSELSQTTLKYGIEIYTSSAARTAYDKARREAFRRYRQEKGCPFLGDRLSNFIAKRLAGYFSPKFFG
ncbi:hypothetical protein DACRYDRAFT_117299 [Dacryopinax primogenitus]|uniref:Uncharacterized protein n=1 Tax=Dacryopinax primogenitus (strain DJM 731) TaxID=1858805 RepID=M5G8Z2_DACPD|nr:uncharacterized protein DACRYDRAFT_117299 [Dacryopinax primogenitus]EJU00243.1 hypothetical protein DACRYDRAFT_117299 [Dacryopinax primogenitus]